MANNLAAVDSTEATRIGVSPIGTTSANSGATAATNSSYAQGAYTSGIAGLDPSVTTYVLNDTDYQGIVRFNTSSAVTVTLNSAVKTNFQASILNIGTGAITITTSDGSPINSGPSTLTGGSQQGFQVFYSQRSWTAYAGTTVVQVVPQTFAPILHQWLKSYSASTGLFTSTQPDYSDLTGTPQLAQTVTPVSGKYLVSYDASTGTFTANATAGISANIVTAALTPTGAQGSMTFLDGLLVSQVQAT